MKRTANNKTTKTIGPYAKPKLMDATPATIYTIWAVGVFGYLFLRVSRIRRQRRIARSLQTAVRDRLKDGVPSGMAPRAAA